MSPKLLVQDSATGSTYTCAPGQTLFVGRQMPQASQQIACDDPHVSRHHCDFIGQGGSLLVVDRSTAGTFINDQRVQGQATAQPGDRIRLGPQYLFTLGIEGGASGQGAEKIANRYRIVRELAEGGMGLVYEGFDEQRGQRCAIKVLKGSKVNDNDVKRFQREGQLGQRLGSHPGIVAAFDSGALPSGELYCVMDFVEGRSLEACIKDGLSLRQGVALVTQVAQAVAYAHERDVVHRDLKPSNIMVTATGEARLTDFGVAKALDSLEGLTTPGAVMGTLSFMSPEQVTDSSAIDVRTDVYGLGAILYTVIAKRPPLNLSGMKMKDALKLALAGPPATPSQLNPEVDAPLESICMRAMSREPADRQPGAGALAQELESWARGGQLPSASAGQVPARKDDEEEEEEEESAGRSFLIIVGVGLLLFCGLLAYALFGR